MCTKLAKSLDLDVNLLECPICLSFLAKPITLNCGHNFCENCVKNPKFYSSKQCCPVCRRPILSNLKHFKENLLLQALLSAKFAGNEEYKDRLDSLRKSPFSQTKARLWVKLLKKWLRILRKILKSLGKMIPGFTLENREVLAIFLLFKLKYEILSIDTKKMEMAYTSQLNKLVHTIKNPNLSLKTAENEINMQTLVFSKLMKHPTLDLFVSCSSDKSLRVWAKDGKNDDSYVFSDLIENDHTKTIRTVAWSNNGSFLASGSFDATISIFRFFQGKFQAISKLEGHENEIKSLSWDPSDTFLASCSRDKTIMLWDCEKDGISFEFSCAFVLNGHEQDVKFVKWRPNSQFLFSCGYDDTIKVWQSEEDDWICAQTLKSHASTVWSLDFSPDSRYMFSVSDDQSVKIWDVSSENYEKNPALLVISLGACHSRAIYSVSCSFDGEFFATAGADNSVCVFRRNRDNLSGDGIISFDLFEKKPQAHENDVNCVAFHPKTNVFATCSDDFSIKVWKINDFL